MKTRAFKKSAAVESLISSLLDNGNQPTAKFIITMLLRYNLSSSLLSEVLNEAYVRSTRSKEPIVNPEPFLKKVCLHIIQEWSRRERRFDSLDIEDSDATLAIAQKLYHDCGILDEIIIKDHPISHYKDDLRRAWHKLSPKQQRIIHLRIIMDLPWKEVADLIGFEQSKAVSESTARQQGNRALASLREKMLDQS